MKKRLLVCALLVLMLLSVTARADMGPKPSVRVSFEGLGDEPCYGTLLSERASTGPASAWDGTESMIDSQAQYFETDLDFQVWKAFVQYEDPDGYYFLQESWRVDETGLLSWTYYPPTPFKILLYFPDSGVFLSSGVQERYAFDSSFTVDVTGPGLEVTGSRLTAERSYDYSWETVSLLARIVLTIALELAVALLFGYRRRKQILTIAVVNVITQTALNVLLNLVNYSKGPMTFVFCYFVFELLVFVIEAAVYAWLLPRLSGDAGRKGHPVLYALAANAVSFAAGYAVAKLIPGIF